MRKFLDKQISVKIILVFLLTIVFSLSAAAAAVTTIQAQLRPDITIRYNGDIQTLRDANGGEVYPLSYNGTTYLPVRAISGLVNLPVDWDGATNTVFLGKKESAGKPFTEAARRISDAGASRRIDAAASKDEFPLKLDDFGNSLGVTEFTNALKTTGWSVNVNNDNYPTWSAYELDGRYSTFTFTAAISNVSAAGNIRINIRCADTKTILKTVTLAKGEFLFVEADIRNVRNIRIEAIHTVRGYTGTLYLLDPAVA